MENERNHRAERRYFDRAFKEDAVNRVINTGKRSSEVARELGISPNLLPRWKRDYLSESDAHSGGKTRGLKPSEIDAEIQRLHRQLADVTEQRDILKKALSVFAQPPRKGSSS